MPDNITITDSNGSEFIREASFNNASELIRRISQILNVNEEQIVDREPNQKIIEAKIIDSNEIQIGINDYYYEEFKRRSRFLSFQCHQSITRIEDLLNLYHYDLDHREVSKDDKELLLILQDHIKTSDNPELINLLKLSSTLHYSDDAKKNKNLLMK